MTYLRKNRIMMAVIVGTFLMIPSSSVFAAAWWGDGYRDPAWVIAHGGTIINYTIVGAKSTKKYKAMMFRNGEYVEVEFGNNETFDDAKNGLYTINFYKCKKSCMDHKFDKKTKIRGSDKLVATVSVVARPGQTNNVVFDAAAKRAFLAGRSGGFVSVDPFTAAKKEAKEKEGSAAQLASTKKIDYRYKQVTFLSSKTDFSKFAEKNRLVGIMPDYTNHKSVSFQ